MKGKYNHEIKTLILWSPCVPALRSVCASVLFKDGKMNLKNVQIYVHFKYAVFLFWEQFNHIDNSLDLMIGLI